MQVRLGIRAALVAAVRRVEGSFCRIARAPIIVVGNQKSGTSAIASLLADCCGLSKVIDIPPMWPATPALLASGGLQRLVAEHRWYFSKELIKEPDLTFLLEEVLDVFPEASYVFVVRNPRDNVRSILDRYGLPGNLEQANDQVRAAASARPSLFDPAVWGVAGFNYVEVLAHRWTVAASKYLTYRDRLRLVKYEDFLVNKVAVIRALAADLGRTPRYDITARVDVQYQPRGANRAVPPEQFFGANLARIDGICGALWSEIQGDPDRRCTGQS